MEIMPNFKDVQRLQLVFKTSIQATAITYQVGRHLTLAMEFIPPPFHLNDIFTQFQLSLTLYPKIALGR